MRYFSSEFLRAWASAQPALKNDDLSEPHRSLKDENASYLARKLVIS